MAQQKAVEPVADEIDDLIDELQPGAKLLKGQYTITRYINSGGFGITYLAKDSLDRDVVIKECFPGSFCRRSKAVVAARSRAHTAELRSIVQLFVREARNLAKIVHPNIVAVHQVFEDNGTAYMAIDYIDGLDLQQVIEGEGTRPGPEHIVRIAVKLLEAVGFIHDNDMLHRDISPDNVLIDPSGEPILIDFGAAREHASKTNRAMSALRVVKDGYSPQEFYIAGSEQGPWSDLYALGATLYHLIADMAPVNGQARLAALAEDRPDPYVPLAGRFKGYPAGFLQSIDVAMNTLPKQRVQSAREWLGMFNPDAPAADPTVGVDQSIHRLILENGSGMSAAAGPADFAPPPRLSRSPSQAPARSVSSAPKRRNPVPVLAGIAAAVVAVAGAYIIMGGSDGPAPRVTVAGTEVATEAATPEPTVVEIPETVATSVPAPEPVEPTATTDPAATDVAVVEPAAEFAPATDPADETAALPEPEPEALPAPEVEPLPVETAVAPTETADPALATLVPPSGKPKATQIDFAAWDIVLPFTTSDRIIGGEAVAIIQHIEPNADLTQAGDWLQQGLLIYAVNGKPTPTGSELVRIILNALKVDPDGRTRVVVDYAGSSLERQTGLLAVDVVRLVNLSNGVNIRAAAVDGTWMAKVTAVQKPDVSTLQEGDILFRDKTTGLALDAPDTIDQVLSELIAKDLTQTVFSVIRDNKVSEAVMQLTVEQEQ